jgi:hypothetical protein
MALQFKRHDLVLLPDGSEGRVLDILDTGSMTVCKVQRGDQVDYFDEGKLRLKRRFPLKTLLAFFNR